MSTHYPPLHDVTSEHVDNRPEPKKLYRNTSTKMLGGVCSGLADYLNIDVTLVRLGVVAVTLFTGGVGAIGYVAGWVVIPERPL